VVPYLEHVFPTAKCRVDKVSQYRLTVGLGTDPKAEVRTVRLVDAKLAGGIVPSISSGAPHVCDVDLSTHLLLHYHLGPSGGLVGDTPLGRLTASNLGMQDN
jgi:hypothetical protein